MSATSYSRDKIVVGSWSKVLTKVCGFTFGSISLRLINKSLKGIVTQKRLYNAKYLSRFNDKNAFRKYIKKIYITFPDFSCMHRRMWVHATFLVVEIADRLLGQASYG